jgi:hypothetical protein
MIGNFFHGFHDDFMRMFFTAYEIDVENQKKDRIPRK